MSEERRPWGVEAPRITHGVLVDVSCPACGGDLCADDRFELIRQRVGHLQTRDVFWSTTCTQCARRYNYAPDGRRLCPIQELPPEQIRASWDQVIQALQQSFDSEHATRNRPRDDQ